VHVLHDVLAAGLQVADEGDLGERGWQEKVEGKAAEETRRAAGSVGSSR
jgi:hypothetical protein